MNARNAPHMGRRRWLLVALALLFFAPLGASFYLYYGPAWQPSRHVNHGQLIDPPRPLPAMVLPLASSGATDPLFLRHKWTLLYFGSGRCAERCRTDLYATRQIRAALDRDMGRVQRVFLATDACCDMEFLHAQHPDLITVRATSAAASLLNLLPTLDGAAPDTAEGIYLIDPLGNLMMSYAPDAESKGILQDMQRLLRLSHVG